MVNQNSIKVTAEDKARYEREGYWISPKLIDDDQIESLRKAHERIWAGDYDSEGIPIKYFRGSSDPKKIRKLDNGWHLNDEIRNLVLSPLLGELAADLMGVNIVRLWHDQVIYKPGTDGEETEVGNVGWHQDYGYWKTSNTMNMVTAWVALQDTDLSNGGMMTILGSHKWGLIEGSDTFFDQNMSALKEKYMAEGREWVEEPCIMRAGQASFHHALTFHGSGPNLTNMPRLSVVAHLMPGGTAYRAGVQYHPNVRFLGPRPEDGQKFENEFFPVLFKREN